MKELRKILYVEDEPDIQVVARISLESVGGFDVRICSDGMEAINSISDYAPDMVLLDVMMPGMDGISTLKEMNARGLVDNIPVVFMTAKVQPKEMVQYTDAGAVDVIAKPFDPMTLPDTIRKIWNAYNNQDA